MLGAIWHFFGTSQATSLAEWVTGLLTASAFFWTIRLWRLDIRQQKRQQADRVITYVDTDKDDYTDVVVRNTSDQPIWDVRVTHWSDEEAWIFHDRPISQASRNETRKVFENAPFGSIEFGYLHTDDSDSSIGAGAKATRRISCEAFSLKIILTFIDSSGRRWAKELSARGGRYLDADIVHSYLS